jgi:hypothetical protein
MKILKYLSYYKEDKLTNIIILDSAYESNVLIDGFVMYINTKSMGLISYDESFCNKLKGFVMLMSYYCNTFTLNISLNNEHTFIKYGYSFIIRNNFDEIIKYFMSINESIIELLRDYIYNLLYDEEEIFKYISNKKIVNDLKQIINKYNSKIQPNNKNVCDLKTILDNNLTFEEYVKEINIMSNLLINLFQLLNTENILLYTVLIYSSTKIKMNNDILFIEYRGFRIDNFGNNIFTLDNYLQFANQLLIKDTEILPSDEEIFMKNKYVFKLKIPTSSKNIFLLDKRIYKRQNSKGENINLVYNFS